jgi:putative endonuclease
MEPRDRPAGQGERRNRRPGAAGTRRITLGAEGEARAAQWLEARGWRVLARNARAGGVELDLVVARGRIVAFVEVKTRSSRVAGAPEEAVDARKRARLVRGAAAWLSVHGRAGWRARFDVVACEPAPDGTWAIRHTEGAFDASD